MSTQLGWNIIKRFARKNMSIFTLQDVEREFSENNHIYLQRVLSDMVVKGMLYKINSDNYHIIPLHADPETYIPDGHQVAKSIMQNNDYYMGYASAVRIHGIPLLSEATEYIVTKKQMKPAIRSLGGMTFQFIYHSSTRFYGFENTWITKFDEAMVSDLEKTIVDIATKPQLCGGITEVGNVLFQAKDMIDYEKLFFYFANNLNKSAIKRFLFLTELLDMEWTNEHDNILKKIGSGITLLDPSAPDQLKGKRKFRLKINVDPISIKEKVLH